MTYRSLILAGSTAALLTLTGCANTSNQQLGTGAGAVLGGVAGHALFGGTAGAVGGAAAGALVGNEVGKRSDTNKNYQTGTRYDRNGNPIPQYDRDGRRIY